MKQLKQLVEFILIYTFFLIFKFLPIKFVSYLGGLLFQIFGPFTKSHKIALFNYKRIFNDLSDDQIKNDIIR